MTDHTYTNAEAAQALLDVIPDSRWEAVAFARGWSAIETGRLTEESARIIYESSSHTLRRSREIVIHIKDQGILGLIPPRRRIGSAENPITKLFPATITEERFLELLDALCETRPTVHYSDDRESRHGLTDFTILEADNELPINIKNAGTRFERAQQLVGLDPNDCIPIPAYKAHGAVETVPNLLYVVSVDYGLIDNLNALLPTLFQPKEIIVWDLLNKHSGSHVRDAEDKFIFTMVRKYWERINPIVQDNPFHVISARKSIRILQTKPKRTPGIGLRAWGTGASAEVNVHISIQEDTTPWDQVSDRIISEGAVDIIGAVNRRRTELVYDPEI